MTLIAGLPTPRATVPLDGALRAACEGAVGITSAQFRSLLSPEEIDDIAAGAIASHLRLPARAPPRAAARAFDRFQLA